MSKFFCPLPWIHQFIQPDGIKMCCSSQTLVDNVSPLEFVNSSYLKDIKDTIKQGIVPQDCAGCVTAETQGYTSTRLLALNDWNYTVDTVPNQLLYLDIRWSNLCNFSCRSCEPAFSSEIAREQHALPIHRFNHRAVDEVFQMLSSVTRINFTGGEPLLIKENIKVLDNLLALGQTDCEILITTNASVINNDIINLIKQFNNVHWTISIDAVGHTAEYIRYGTVWSRVDANIRSILELRHSVAFNCVLSAYSVLDIDNLVEYFAGLKLQYSSQPLELWFAICEYPQGLHPQALPTNIKRLAKLKIDTAIAILNSIESNPIRSINTLKALLNNLNDSIIYKQDEFITITKTLDDLRNQSFNNVFNLGDVNE